MKPHRDLETSPLTNSKAKYVTRDYSKIKFESFFSIVEKSLDDDRIWVSDFKNDDLYVTNDLFDVIAAFDHFSREIRESS